MKSPKPAQTDKQEREAKLAAALRANLKRRKAGAAQDTKPGSKDDAP